MNPFEEIENDLDWREAELAVLRLLMVNKDVADRERTVLFRAAWALLYSHYEGFCKFSLSVYYNTLEGSGRTCRSLPFSTQCFALSEPVRKMRNLPVGEFLIAISSFENRHLNVQPTFPDVETNSNLWPRTLEALLAEADLALPSLSLHNRKIETLVRRRNKIAPGEKDMIADFDYYIEYEHAFKIIAYELAFAIEQKLSLYPTRI